MTRPVINVLRNALHLLVLVVSRPLDTRPNSLGSQERTVSKSFGAQALKPLLAAHQDFLECLVDKLGSADHALCANALRLLNALFRDAMLNESGKEWPSLIANLHALGVMNSVEMLMRGDAVADLAGPVLEFQTLVMGLFRRWRDITVDTTQAEHQHALRLIRACASGTIDPESGLAADTDEIDEDEVSSRANSRRVIGDKEGSLQALGLDSQHPASEFQGMGYLGLRDLTEYVRSSPEDLQKELLEQSVMSAEEKCPIAKASLSVTQMLYDHFDIGHPMEGDVYARAMLMAHNPDEVDREGLIQPLLLRWDRMHIACTTIFLRLWKTSGATVPEFSKIEDLVRLVISMVIGRAERRLSTEEVERRIGQEQLNVIRQWQLHHLENKFESAWGGDLR